MYFSESESRVHKQAKEKLFDLIVSRRIKIKDQHGNYYDIFTGRNNDEFLHMESFVMDYEPNVIFSNPESPCKKYMGNTTVPRCGMKGYYGAFKELPCTSCIQSNFKKYTTYSSKFASYRPDIAFGYNGLHKIWLEVKNTNPSSKNKIEFCNKNNIVLLEIDEKDINSFKEFSGELEFNKLEEYVEQFNVYKLIEQIHHEVAMNIENNGYAFSDIVNDYFKLNNPEFNIENIKTMIRHRKKLYEKLEKDYREIEIKGKKLRKYFDIYNRIHIWIKKEEFMKLLNEGHIEMKLGEIIDNNNEIEKYKLLGKKVKKQCDICLEECNIDKMVKVKTGLHSHKYYHQGCIDKVIK